jgi:hypothetical protein
MASTDRLVREFESTQQRRAMYEPLWLEVLKFCNANRDFISSSTLPYLAHGAQDHAGKVYSDLGFMAADELSNIMYSYVTPPSVPWFELVVSDRPLSEDRDEQNWLLDLRNLLLYYLYRPETGFPEALQELFLDYVTLGTGCLYVDWYDRRLRTLTRPLDQNYLGVDAEGRVIKHFRLYGLSVEQAYYRFPETLPAKYKMMVEAGDGGAGMQQLRFLHAIVPTDSSVKRWDSTHILYDDKEPIRDTMSRGFHNSFPYICPRWKRVAGEAYGRGQSIAALPSLRVCDKITKLILQATELGVHPPTQEPTDNFMNPSSLLPGKRNYYKKGTRSRIEPINISGEVGMGYQLLERKTADIERMFFLDVARQFSLRGNSSPLKATEVIERRDEVLRLLGPVVARLTNEFLSPLVERIYEVLDEHNLITPAIGSAPSSLGGKPIQPVFSSAASMSMRRSETGDIRAWLEDVAITANIDPNSLITVNGDAIIRKSRYLRNVDPDLTRSKDEVQQILNQRAQQEQLRQLTETASEGGAALTSVAEGVKAIDGVA